MRVHGWCMWPTLWPGDLVRLEKLSGVPKQGALLACDRNGRMILHRLVGVKSTGGRTWLKCAGDRRASTDLPIELSNVTARVTRISPGSVHLRCLHALRDLARFLGWRLAKTYSRGLRGTPAAVTSQPPLSIPGSGSG